MYCLDKASCVIANVLWVVNYGYLLMVTGNLFLHVFRKSGKEKVRKGKGAIDLFFIFINLVNFFGMECCMKFVCSFD